MYSYALFYKLHLVGSPTAPSNLTALSTGTSVRLSWGLPPGTLSPTLLAYSVVVRRGNGTLLFNGTVMELQVIINIPPLCDQYEAIVTATCGGIDGGYFGGINFAAGKRSLLSSDMYVFSKKSNGMWGKSH